MVVEQKNFPPLKIVVLISGSGTNLQSIINATKAGLNIQIQCVISNNANAYGLVRAQQAQIPTMVLPHSLFPNRDAYDQALTECIKQFQPQLIVLAGFMRILGPGFIAHYPQQIINIHPSLLPRHKGLNTHKNVLEAKDTRHGCSIHVVTGDLDAGPIIAQAEIAVSACDTVDTLTQKVLLVEHLLYPEVLSWFSQSRIRLQDNLVFLDDKVLPQIGLKLYIHEPSLLND